MNEFDMRWQGLVALARRADDGRLNAAPAGFAARVTARAMALPDSNGNAWSAFERLATRGLFLAIAMVVVAITFNYAEGRPDLSSDNEFPDVVSDMLGSP